MRFVILVSLFLVTELKAEALEKEINGVTYTAHLTGYQETAEINYVSAHSQSVTVSVNVRSTVTFEYTWYTYTYDDDGQSIKIPHTRNLTGPVTDISFSSPEMTSITIPNTVTSVSLNCSGLTSVTIPEHVIYTNLDGCSGLTSVIWNAKNETDHPNIPSSVTHITIGSQVETLPAGFASETKITNINIPNSVKVISYNAFRNCI